MKHGIDFEQAKKLWEDPNRIIIEARTTDEKRFLLIARLDKSVWSAVYTHRNEFVRIISVRKSRGNEKEIYYSY
ncbi:BrnT family toxin [Cyclobacterium roseum]|uniref:BrnT family toxin n=1 Tax=Cyclobacterium roseum TaxID=2666137 RepID=UPI001391A44F|nr:BrnT family toxin [Cyclobacterium roseum]